MVAAEACADYLHVLHVVGQQANVDQADLAASYKVVRLAGVLVPYLELSLCFLIDLEDEALVPHCVSRTWIRSFVDSRRGRRVRCQQLS
jgi:hypothetical protein